MILKEPHPPGTIQAWIVAVGTLTIAATLMVAITREHVDRLVARLAEAADTDPLTELLNRRGFNRQLELELERAQRSGTEVSLITGDLDHFKQVNDRFGHQTGDEVLVQIGDVLRRHARRIDCVARIGGEEFALLLPTADSRGAYVSAERLRHRVREVVSADATRGSRSASASPPIPATATRSSACCAAPTSRSTRRRPSAATGP